MQLEKISDQELIGRLFGSRQRPSGRGLWVSPTIEEISDDQLWRPLGDLPIDLFIEEYAATKRKGRIRIRPRHEFSRSYCPFYDVRLYVMEAAREARAVAVSNFPAAVLSANRIGRDVEKLNGVISRIEDLFPINPYTWLHVLRASGAALDAREIDQKTKRFYAVVRSLANSGPELVQRLKQLANLGEEEKARLQQIVAPANNRGDSWGQVFIEHLGYYFFFMTGAAPTADNAFESFVCAVYGSVSERAFSPRGQIRTVVDRMNARSAGDGFERGGKNRPNPGAVYVNRRAISDDEQVRGSILEARLSARPRPRIRRAAK